jgi:hypothetical protein
MKRDLSAKKMTEVLESIDISKKDEAISIPDLQYQAYNMIAVNIPRSAKLYLPDKEEGITLGNINAVITRVTKDIDSLKNIYGQLKNLGLK